MISAALLGTVARCQNYYSAYSPGGNSGSPSSYGQYSPSILSRGTPRLVPVKVRSSANRLFPSYFYPGPPPPPPPHYPHSHSSFQPQMHAQHSTYPNHHNTPTFPRHQPYRTAMTGYYRPTRQSSSSYFSSSPYREVFANLTTNLSRVTYIIKYFLLSLHLLELTTVLSTKLRD